MTGTPVGLEYAFNRQSEMTKIIVFLHKINAFGPHLNHVKPEWVASIPFHPGGLRAMPLSTILTTALSVGSQK